MATPHYHGKRARYYHTVSPVPFTPGIYSGDEIASVPLPSPGRVPVSAGHWYRKPNEKPKPQPRTDPKPTGGKVVRSTKCGNPKRRRKPQRTSPNAMSMAAAHAGWAKGKDIC